MDIGIPTAIDKHVLAVHKVETERAGEVRPALQSSPTMFTDALFALLESVKSPTTSVTPLQTSASTKSKGATQASCSAAKKESVRSKDDERTDSKRGTEGCSVVAQNEMSPMPTPIVVVQPVMTESLLVTDASEKQPCNDGVTAFNSDTPGVSNGTHATTGGSNKAPEPASAVSLPAFIGVSGTALDAQTEPLAAKITSASTGPAVAAGKDVQQKTSTTTPEPKVPHSPTPTLPDIAPHLAHSSPAPIFTNDRELRKASQSETPNISAARLTTNVFAAAGPRENSVPFGARVLSSRTESVSAVASDSFSVASSSFAAGYPNSVGEDQQIGRSTIEVPSKETGADTSAVAMALSAGVSVPASAESAKDVQPRVKAGKPRTEAARPAKENSDAMLAKAKSDEVRSESSIPYGAATKIAPQRSADEKKVAPAVAKHPSSGTPTSAEQRDVAVRPQSDGAPLSDPKEPNPPSSGPRTITQDVSVTAPPVPTRGADMPGHSSPGHDLSTASGSRGEHVSGNTVPQASERLEPSHGPLLVQNARLVQQSAHSEIKVELRTPEAGRVEVHTVTRDGRTEAVISAEVGETRQALMSALPEMQQRFHDNNVHIQFQSSMGTTMDGHDGGQRQGQRNEPSPIPQQLESPLDAAPSMSVADGPSDSSLRSTRKLSVHA